MNKKQVMDILEDYILHPDCYYKSTLLEVLRKERKMEESLKEKRFYWILLALAVVILAVTLRWAK